MNRRWPHPHKDSEFAMSFIMNNGRVQLEFYVDDKNSTHCLISLSLYSYFLFCFCFCFIFSEDCIILLKLVSICILNTLN